jgi:hypothetical protein
LNPILIWSLFIREIQEKKIKKRDQKAEKWKNGINVGNKDKIQSIRFKIYYCVIGACLFVILSKSVSNFGIV